MLRLSAVTRRLSARESRNPPLAAPTDQDSAPHPRTFTQRQQQLFTVRIPTKGCRFPTLSPPPRALQLSRLQGYNSLKIHSCHPFSEALTNQTTSRDHWGAILKRKPNCRCQLLAKRKPHCRHQLSRKNISSFSLTIVQKDLKSSRRSNVARAEVSCARELGESLRYTPRTLR